MFKGFYVFSPQHHPHIFEEQQHVNLDDIGNCVLYR